MDIQPRYLTLAELLENRLFRIPQYQRAYSWQSKQRKDMFEDIRKLSRKTVDSFHFMATVVGLYSETKTIVIDKFRVTDIVDGQQRLTTLVLLLKAIEKNLNISLPTEDTLAKELQKLLVKQDDASLILLQTNHDRSHYYANYIRSGNYPPVKEAQTLADRELLSAIKECEDFVNEWENKVELLGIIKNQLTFIFHEINEEAAVYTVFEVLNNRGLHVSWLDRLKSMLMSVAFENDEGNSTEHINELHRTWGLIYKTIGLRQGLSTEALRFCATLRYPSQVSKTLGEQQSVVSLIDKCKTAAESIDVSTELLDVTEAFDRLLKHTSTYRRAVRKIAHARLLAVAILLRKFPSDQEKKIIDQWEKTTFRIFGLCGKDARTSVGDYVRLAWEILNQPLLDTQSIIDRIKDFNKGYSINEAFTENPNCYVGWEEELHYLLFCYEKHLAEQTGQNLSQEQWNRIWQESAAKSIEHILPQSKGSQEPLEEGEAGIYVHRLGNLLLLPLGDNSRLSNNDPEEKVTSYEDSGFFIARDVAKTIRHCGWGTEQIEERERKILEWARDEWR